jgi:quercetin dioxygenase-like cupin family protein
MKHLPIDDVPHSPHPRGVTDVRRLIGDELDTEDIDLTYYEVAPKDKFAGAYHRHLEREEIYIILSGIAKFQTEEGIYTVEEGETIYFEPGEWQLGYNEADEPVTSLLVGIPKPLAPVEAYLSCPECEEKTRFHVNPTTQKSGEKMDEQRICTRCETEFEIK